MTGPDYLGWSPMRFQIQLIDASQAPVTVSLRGRRPQRVKVGGQVVFAKSATDTPTDRLRLDIPDGKPVDFYAAGKYHHPSRADKDVEIRAVRIDEERSIAEKLVMVRIRKNANKLTPAERDRFLDAFGKLNASGAGRFRNFRDMHRDRATAEAHFDAGFLAWHRAYLLDLERELQKIDPAVALPYWRFDQPARKLFTRRFMGQADTTGSVQFIAGHALESWETDSVRGIRRLPNFDTQREPANGIDENRTLALGTTLLDFLALEDDPHGLAHTSFNGYLDAIETAVKDPLFFLLHANVDRLWAKWQYNLGPVDAQRYDPATPASHVPPGRRIGHNLNDSMWPWNGITGGDRPPTAPGGELEPSAVVSAPGGKPRVRDMLDYGGAVVPANGLGFDYDDVQYGRRS